MTSNFCIRATLCWATVISLMLFSAAWGPAASAQEEAEELPAKSRTKPRKRVVKVKPRKVENKTRSTKTSSVQKVGPAKVADPVTSDQELTETEDFELSEGAETGEWRSETVARDLAVRVVGISAILVKTAARQFVPKGLEARLAERLLQDLTAKTYFEPVAIEGEVNLGSSPATLASASKKSTIDGILVFQIGLEQIDGFLAAASGRRIQKFEIKYRVGELEEANAVSILSDRIVESVVLAIPYRGFVTSSAADGIATINLGSNHGVKEGDILELFEFRRPRFNSTHRFLKNVKVLKVLGPSESQIGPTDESNASPTQTYAKISFSTSKNSAVTADDNSVVLGRWWFGFGGEVDSFGAEAAAPKYESRVFKINGSPFGYAAGGNDVLTFRGSFGSARSDTETLSFFDLQGTYSIYQFGGSQSAWTIAAGGRLFMIQVTPVPNSLSALSSTNLVSPLIEAKYKYVPRGRIRLVATGEVFWPIYTSGAQVGALLFAFGAGGGLGMQIAITNKFGFEVFGKLRYLRRPIEGQSGVQERQSMLGAGLLFSF